MSDSEEENSRDTYSSERETPVPRNRSPSADSVRSTASKRSRTRLEQESPERRSRSPIRMDRGKAALIAENRALKKQLEIMAQKIEEQQRVIDKLRTQQQTQHEESMARLSNITKLLEAPKTNNNTVSLSVTEAMETDQDRAKKQDNTTTPAKAPKQQGTKEKPSTSKTGEDEATTTAAKEPKVPPVVLRNKENWNEVSRLLKTAEIEYTKARLISEGI